MMTTSNWLSPDVMRPAGWALLHFLWQGTALAALATVAMAPFRKASARYVVAVGILLMMLAAPVATFFYYRTADAVSTRTASAPAAAFQNATVWRSAAQTINLSQRTAPDLFPVVVELWLVGVAIFSLRSAGGFFLLERMRRRESVPVGSELGEICVDLQHRLGLTRAIRYAQCRWLEAPAVIGWFRPIVFLPVAALTGLSEAQLQAVIAHELAHIKRLDSFVNAFQVVVETLLFYHPAVWWLNKRIRLERENCCDDTAIALCGNAIEYARALTLMEEWRVAPALALAVNGGSLKARITRLLGIDRLRSGFRGIGLTASALCLTVALLAGNAIFGIARKVSAQATPPEPPSVASPAKPASAPRTPVKNSPGVKPSPPVEPQAPLEPFTAGSYIEGMKAVGLGEIGVEELIAMKVQGISPEYIRGLQEAGLHPGIDEVIAMKVQGVTPEYVRNLRSTGVTISEEEIIAMKVQGVDANYVQGIQAAGLKPHADELIGMKVQGVTPDYVSGLKAEGIETSTDEIIGMRVQGVTPEYVREIRALGFKPTADEVIGMRVQGVTAEYIKALQAAGFKVNVDEAIGAKVQGITPEFIEKARKHGFQNLTLDKLIQLRHLGILDRDGEI
jgi:beta-lactamase regulating signal transducer with metallopeptidase domain